MTNLCMLYPYVALGNTLHVANALANFRIKESGMLFTNLYYIVT